MKKNVKLIFFVFTVLFFAMILDGCPREPEQNFETYTITFDGKNGEEPVKLLVERWQIINKPAKPVRDGWEFVDWYDNNGNSFSAYTLIDSDVTFTAKWQGTVIFDTHKGKIEKKFYEGESVESPDVSDYEDAQQKKKYFFLYWSTNKNATDETRATDEFNLSNITSSPVTLYPVYTSKPTVKVTFDYNSTNGDIFTKNVVKGELATDVLPIRTNFTFSHWYLDEGNSDDYKNPFDFTKPINDDITLKAKWLVDINSEKPFEYFSNGLIIINCKASEISEEEVEDLSLYFTTNSNSNSQQIEIKKQVIKENQIFYYFDFLNPKDETEYTVFIEDKNRQHSYTEVIYPLERVTNYRVEAYGDEVWLYFAKKNFSYYTIKYYPKDSKNDVKTLEDFSETEYKLTNLEDDKDYIFEIYTQSNEKANAYDLPIEYSEAAICEFSHNSPKKSDYLMVLYLKNDEKSFSILNDVEFGLDFVRDYTRNPKDGFASVYVVAFIEDGDSPKVYEIGTDTSFNNVISSNTKDFTSLAFGKGDKNLETFLSWVNENYKADDFIFQFSGDDMENVQKLLGDIKIDNKMILLDADYGASLENAEKLKSVAKYLVASPNVMAEDGIHYENLMMSFTEDSTIETVGKALIEDYATYSKWDVQWTKIQNELAAQEGKNLEDLSGVEGNELLERAKYLSEKGIPTLSMIDLSKVDELKEKIENLPKLLEGKKEALSDFVGNSGTSGDSLYYGEESLFLDIGYMMDKFKKADNELTAHCESIVESLKSVIVKSWRDSPHSNDNVNGPYYGFTIYKDVVDAWF